MSAPKNFRTAHHLIRVPASLPLGEFPIETRDIALGLAKQCRYGGQCDGWYSVAEHSMLMAEWAERAGMSLDVQLCCMLHDAAEAYIGDIPSPFKSLAHGFCELEAAIMARVCRHYNVVFGLLQAKVKDIDTRILIDEMDVLFPSLAQADYFDGAENVQRLGVDIKCLDWQFAASLFEYRLEQLLITRSWIGSTH